VAEEFSFEDGLNRLEKIVQTLEAGGISLEEAIALFEEGMQLAKICSQRLDTAELKISQLQTTVEQETEDEDKTP
jgi:exodeoxyribonuclease VII small subunit